MSHIHIEPGGHDMTASAFVVRTDRPEPAVYLHRHKKLDRWLQFGGHIERTENPWAAIAHELLEESGYELGQLDVLQPVKRIKMLADALLHPVPVCANTHRFNEGHYHSDLAYAFVAGGVPGHAVVEGESEHLQAFNASELRALPSSEIFENVREIALYILEDVVGSADYEQVPATAFGLELH